MLREVAAQPQDEQHDDDLVEIAQRRDHADRDQDAGSNGEHHEALLQGFATRLWLIQKPRLRIDKAVR